MKKVIHKFIEAMFLFMALFWAYIAGVLHALMELKS